MAMELIGRTTNDTHADRAKELGDQQASSVRRSLIQQQLYIKYSQYNIVKPKTSLVVINNYHNVKAHVRFICLTAGHDALKMHDAVAQSFVPPVLLVLAAVVIGAAVAVAVDEDGKMRKKESLKGPERDW